MLDLTFDVYGALFPDALTIDGRERLFATLRAVLERPRPDDAVCAAAGYALCVDLFEDRGTRDDTWAALTIMDGNNWRGRLRRVLKNSAAVPWDAKVPVFRDVFVSSEGHLGIYEAFAYSVDETRARLMRADARRRS